VRPHSAGSDRPDAPAGPHEALIAEDPARACQEFTADERGFRDLESSYGLRPVFHHREDRIRVYVPLCWLALLLIRVARERSRRHLVHHPPRTGPDGPGSPRRARRAGRPTLRDHPRQKTIMAALELTDRRALLWAREARSHSATLESAEVVHLLRGDLRDLTIGHRIRDCEL
jgi:hypothetical protein